MQRKIILLLAALVVAFMFVGAASAATPVATKNTVSATVPTGPQEHPAVTSSGPRVVWEQTDATTGFSNVWVKNTVTGNTQVVEAMAYDQAKPDIMNNYVTWQQTNPVTSYESIYIRNIATGNWGVLANAAFDQENARIGLNQTNYQVVFDQNTGQGNHQIYIKAVGTSQFSPAALVCANPNANQIKPDISRNIIVWQQNTAFDPSTQFKVWYANAVTGEAAAINTIYGWQIDPRVSGVNVVYHSFDTLFITNLSVLVINPGNVNIATTKLANLVNDPNMRNFDIDGNRVVWQQEVNNVRDVWVMNIATGNTLKVSSSLLAQSEPAISGDYVVWVQKTLPFESVFWRNIANGVNGKVT
jgi:hypothetical protein